MLIDTLFRAVWVRGSHVSDPGVVEAIGDEVGLSGSDQDAPPAPRRLTRRPGTGAAPFAYFSTTFGENLSLPWGAVLVDGDR